MSDASVWFGDVPTLASVKPVATAVPSTKLSVPTPVTVAAGSPPPQPNASTIWLVVVSRMPTAPGVVLKNQSLLDAGDDLARGRRHGREERRVGDDEVAARGQHRRRCRRRQLQGQVVEPVRRGGRLAHEHDRQVAQVDRHRVRIEELDELAAVGAARVVVVDLVDDRMSADRQHRLLGHRAERRRDRVAQVGAAARLRDRERGAQLVGGDVERPRRMRVQLAVSASVRSVPVVGAAGRSSVAVSVVRPPMFGTFPLAASATSASARHRRPRRRARARCPCA